MAKYDQKGDTTDMEDSFIYIEIPTEYDAAFNAGSTNLTATQSGTYKSMARRVNDELKLTGLAKGNPLKRNINDPPTGHQNTSASGIRSALSSPHTLPERITNVVAGRVFETLKNFKKDSTLELTPKICSTIKKCLKDFPNLLDNHEVIASLCKVDQKLVLKYLDTDTNLTMDEINIIKQSSKDSVGALSNKLCKHESVITEYIHQYAVHPVEHELYTKFQEKQIEEISKAFENVNFSLTEYKTIVTHPYELQLFTIIDKIKYGKISNKVQNLIPVLLHLIFYYLKCSLPFEDIIQIISKMSDISLTAHDLFHIIFQLSDPVLRGICIEDYSFSNAIPLYYPILKPPQTESNKVQFEICKELWYCLEQYNGLISFGLGRASWNTVGKSTLLDLIFETDFVEGNPQNSAFHFGSIDIQLTKNLFGEKSKANHSVSTKLAYIDCHGYSDLSVIQVLCSHLEVAIIHVCYNDYKNNKDQLNNQLNMFNLKHTYIFLRDCDCKCVTTEHKRINNADVTYIFVPDLTRMDISLINSLKAIGYEILHLDLKRTQVIQSQFIYEIIQILKDPAAKDIQMDSELIENITQPLYNSKEIDFSFLIFYPIFVEYMSAYHQASHELDQNAIDTLNSTCKSLDKKLKDRKTGDFVMFFNYILSKPNSISILRKLSRELSHIHSQKLKAMVVSGKGQKNIEYTLEIFWRETLLSYKYVHYDPVNSKFYDEVFVSSYNKHVESGEAFELIDGENLSFFNNLINSLLCRYYARESNLLEEINKNNTIKIKPAPIVVSILGPQSSGKSTLLNYCFGCNFLTSAGRCTRGIYASLSKLDRPVNLSQSFLILDTEGLDAIERDNIKDTSMIHFDKTMVLFCLAVSQVVIINVKGDIGNEMLNLLQICAYSLNRLKVNKVKAPKIFFVLNQQTDPDPNKHLDAINLLMEKLNSESGLMEIGMKISDLIQVSRENIFILPSAFNSQQMNKPDAKLFDSNIIKLSPTIAFADKCTELRLAIINQLDRMSVNDRAPFQNMSEWMVMAGVVWDTIIQYQDIFKFQNFGELKCSNELNQIYTGLKEKHIYYNQNKLMEILTNLYDGVDSLETYESLCIVLLEKTLKFDKEFETYQNAFEIELSQIFPNHSDLIQNSISEEETTSKIKHFNYNMKKQYNNIMKLEIESILTAKKLLESMNKFQSINTENLDIYLNYDTDQVGEIFEKLWKESYGTEEEEKNRRWEMAFSQLYFLFLIEYGEMENQHKISQLFSGYNFDIDEIIDSIECEILNKFLIYSPGMSEQFIIPIYRTHARITDMTPYNQEVKYSYVCQMSLYEIDNYWNARPTIALLKYIPCECESLLQYCSGFYSPPDIIWESSKTVQIQILKGFLRDPDNFKTNIWKKFINDISSDVSKLLNLNTKVSHSIVKKIIHALCSRIKLLNHEIGFIHARLSSIAEKRMSTLAFAFAFKCHYQHMARIKHDKTKIKKNKIFETFSKNIGNIKMIREKWNRDWVARWDKEKSQKFAFAYIDLVKKELRLFVHQNMETLFEDRKESLSHESVLSLAHELLLKELAKEPSKEVTDVDNFVVQYICNRNTVLERLFQEKFEELELLIHATITGSLKIFHEKNLGLKYVMNVLFSELQKIVKSVKNLEGFDSDKNFESPKLDKLNPNDNAIRRLPFKAMVEFLKMYLDPKLPQGKFMKHIFTGFEIDGLKVVASDNYALCSKPIEPILDEDTFQKLVNTGMFNSTELILNIFEYVKQFQDVMNGFEIELKQNEFHEMTASLRKEFQKKIFGCPSQCPSCGKFCEREVHTNEGKCQIKTGHQISSMGGKVWNADKDNTAVLFICDDYKNYTRVTSPCGEMEWGEFKGKCGSEWNWTLPTDKMNTSKQLSNQKIMKDVWNKFGRGILNCYETQGTRISYVPYTDSEEVEMKKRLGQANQSAGRGSVSSGDIEIFIDYKN